MIIKPITPRLNIAHPLAQGLRGAWLLGEGTGTGCGDATPSHNDADFIGVQRWDADESKYGPMPYFEGTMTYLKAEPRDQALDITKELTIVSRFKSIWDHWQFIVIKGPSGSAGDNESGNYEFRSDSSQRLQLRHQRDMTGAASQYNTAVNFTLLNQWGWYGVTLREGGMVRFYRNGLFESEVAQYGAFGMLNDEPVRIGTRKDFYTYWKGWIDYVFIWQRELAPQDMLSLYADPFALFETAVHPAVLAQLVVGMTPLLLRAIEKY